MVHMYQAVCSNALSITYSPLHSLSISILYYVSFYPTISIMSDIELY